MDEATSNLDTITEKAIEKNMHEFSKGITTIVIANRLSTIMSCDNIFVLEKGEILDVGCHNKLINEKCRYHSLWQSQSFHYNEDKEDKMEVLACDEV